MGGRRRCQRSPWLQRQTPCDPVVAAVIRVEMAHRGRGFGRDWRNRNRSFRMNFKLLPSVHPPTCQSVVRRVFPWTPLLFTFVSSTITADTHPYWRSWLPPRLRHSLPSPRILPKISHRKTAARNLRGWWDGEGRARAWAVTLEGTQAWAGWPHGKKR